jgi:WD40 repeat protein
MELEYDLITDISDVELQGQFKENDINESYNNIALENKKKETKSLSICSKIVHNQISHEFFIYLKDLPSDIKRYILLILMGKSAFGCFDYSQILQSDYFLSTPVVFNPNGRSMLVTCFPKNIFGLSLTHNIDALLFDLPSGEILFQYKGTKNIETMAFSRDGKSIVIATQKYIQILDRRTGYILTELKELYDGTPVAMSPDGNKVILELKYDFTKESENENFGNEYILVDLGLERLPLRQYKKNIRNNIEYEKELKIQSLIQTKLNIDVQLVMPRSCQFQFTNNNLIIISSALPSREFFPIILDEKTGKPIQSNEHLELLTIFSSDNSKIATYKSGVIVILDYNDNYKVLQSITCDHNIISLEFSPDGSIIIADCLYKDEFVTMTLFHVWDVISGQKLYSKKGSNYPQFNLDGNFIFAVCQDFYKINFWHARTGILIKTLKFPTFFNEHRGDGSPHIVSSPYCDIIYLGLKNCSQLLSCKNIGQSSTSNRLRNEDSIWELFLKLYPLFYIEEKENIDQILNEEKEFFNTFGKNNNSHDTVINFSEFNSINIDESIIEDDNIEIPEKSIYELFLYFIFWFMLLPFIFILLLILLFISPLLIIGQLIRSFLCEIRFDG